MALNYAEKWEPELLEIVMDGSYTSPFITTAVRWLDAKTFHFTRLAVGGYKNHSRNGGWNAGTYTQEDVPFTVTHDRDIEFMVDKADVDETNATASIQNISRTFTQTQQTPETDAYFFERVAQAAKRAGLYDELTLDDFAKSKTLTQVKAAIAKVRRYKNKGIIVYVRPEIMDNLQMSTEVQKTIDVTTISESGRGIETRVASIDGVPVMELIDDDRFYTKFNYEPADGGFEQAEDAQKLLLAIATPMTTKTVPKIASIYSFAPGSHTKGDGWLYQNRALWDTFTFPNGRTGKVDSLYVVAEKAAAGA